MLNLDKNSQTFPYGTNVSIQSIAFKQITKEIKLRNKNSKQKKKITLRGLLKFGTFCICIDETDDFVSRCSIFVAKAMKCIQTVLFRYELKYNGILDFISGTQQ